MCEVRAFAIEFEEWLLDISIADQPAQRDADAEDVLEGLLIPELAQVPEQSHGVLAGFELDIFAP